MLRSRVPQAAAGSALADWLAGRFRYHDRATWCAEIAAGRVLRNGAAAGVGDRLAAGDEIGYTPAPAPVRAGPAPVILLDDPGFVAIDKPAHLVAHATGAFPASTFVHELAARCAAGAGLTFVHRLDRETSGVLLLAKNAAANAALQRQFAAGAVHKHYLAIVHGAVRDARFTVDAPIGPAAAGGVAVRRAVVAPPAGRAARTEVEVVQRFAAHTLLRLTPRTGRTHQLRVHLHHVGHPLVGDKLYGRSDSEYGDWIAHVKAGGDPAWDHRLGAGRQLLHAAELRLQHPQSGAPLALHAPLPADFEDFLAARRGG